MSLLQNLRCPVCFSKSLREGVGLRCLDDEEIEIRSMDGPLNQCLRCGHDGFENEFENDTPKGCLSIGRGTEKICLSRGRDKICGQEALFAQ